MNLKSPDTPVNPILPSPPISDELNDLPLYQLAELDLSTLSTDQLKEIITHCNEQRTSGQQRAAKVRKESKVIHRKDSSVINDF